MHILVSSRHSSDSSRADWQLPRGVVQPDRFAVGPEFIQPVGIYCRALKSGPRDLSPHMMYDSVFCVSF